LIRYYLLITDSTLRYFLRARAYIYLAALHHVGIYFSESPCQTSFIRPVLYRYIGPH